MADPSSSAGESDFPEEDDGGGESTVSMTSPTLDPAMPLPISVPPPAMQAASPGPQLPTAPAPFAPGGAAAFPVQGRPPPASQPSVPTPFGGITPNAPPSQPKPLPAAGAPPLATSPVPGAFSGGMKRPQTVIGLAPPPVGAPRPGAPGAGRVPLPSGRAAPPAAPAAPAAPRVGPASAPGDKAPPSSSRGVKPPAIPVAPPSPAKPLASKDADSTDEQLAMPDDTPDSQKEEMPTMAKSAEESLALFGLGSGLTDAARAAVVAKPGAPIPAAGRAPGPNAGVPASRPQPAANVVQPISALSNEQETTMLPRMGGAAPGPLPAAGAPPAEELPVLHDRSEEEESTRAVSREEMLRGHDAVIIGEDGEGAQGEDATLAVAPGLNEANSQHLAALAAQLTKESPHAQQAPPEPQGAFPPPFGQPPQQQAPQAPPGWQDPGGFQPQAQQAPQLQQPWQDPNAFQQQQGWNGPPSYPMGSVGPVSGPHMPAANPYPQSSPHMQVPHSSPQLAVPQSGHMPAAYPGQNPQGPIPYPGQPNIHQPPPNPFGEWNAAPLAPKKFVLSGQILLLAIVGTVCLAIFITGIVLFATTKF